MERFLTKSLRTLKTVDSCDFLVVPGGVAGLFVLAMTILRDSFSTLQHHIEGLRSCNLSPLPFADRYQEPDYVFF